MERIQLYPKKGQAKVTVINKENMEIYSFEIRCFLSTKTTAYVTVRCSTICFRNKRHSGRSSVVLTVVANTFDSFVVGGGALNFETVGEKASKEEMERQMERVFNQNRAGINSILYDLEILGVGEEIGRLGVK